MRKALAILGLTLMVLAASLRSGSEVDNLKNLIAWWKLEAVDNGRVTEIIGRKNDQITGNFKLVNGLVDKAIRFDGFTTLITRKAAEVPVLNQSFTIEAWVARLPTLELVSGDCSTSRSKGRILFRDRTERRSWIRFSCKRTVADDSSAEKIPLRKWSQIVASFDRESGVKIYINGRLDKTTETKGSFLQARESDLLIGMNYEKIVPSDPVRPQATLPARYSFDGIVDEIKIFGRALDEATITQSYQLAGQMPEPDIPLRVMPSGRTGRGVLALIIQS